MNKITIIFLGTLFAACVLSLLSFSVDIFNRMLIWRLLKKRKGKYVIAVIKRNSGTGKFENLSYVQRIDKNGYSYWSLSDKTLFFNSQADALKAIYKHEFSSSLTVLQL